MASILIVDDDISLCQIMDTVLSSAGYTVTVTHDGRSALERAGRQPYDVAIVDLCIPHMNGLEIIRELQKIVPDIGLILISGLLPGFGTAPTLAGLTVALSDVVKLAKPFRRDDLLETVARCAALRKPTEGSSPRAA